MKCKFLLLFLLISSSLSAYDFVDYFSTRNADMTIQREGNIVVISDNNKSINESDVLYKVSYILKTTEMYKDKYNVLIDCEILSYWSPIITVMMDKEWINIYFVSNDSVRRDMVSKLVNDAFALQQQMLNPQTKSKRFFGLF